MTDMPPTRFRVVERGRRLEVIDTQAGKVPAPRVGKRAPPNLPSARTDPGRAWWPEKIRFDGGSVWTTRRFYDAKGPRTLTLDAGTVEQLRMAGGIAGAALIAWLVLASFVPEAATVRSLHADHECAEIARTPIPAPTRGDHGIRSDHTPSLPA